MPRISRHRAASYLLTRRALWRALSASPQASHSTCTPWRRSHAGFRALGRGFSPSRAQARHLGTDLRPRDGRGDARHERIRAISRAAGVHRIDVAIHQPALLGLARDHRKRAREGICRPACARREGLRRRPLHLARPVGNGVVFRRCGRPIRNTCGRSSRRLPRSPGASRAAAHIGKPNCSMRSPSSTAAGRSHRT